jgi:hypothetical protein
MFLEFEFGWDKSSTIADVRDAMGRAETQFPAGAESYSISEINFSEFPIIIVALSGDAPERTLIRLANEMQTCPRGAVAGAGGGSCRHARGNARGHPRPARARGL